MKILLDQHVPVPAVPIISRVLLGHKVDHVELVGWGGKGDTFLYVDAAKRGYEAVVTNDKSQLNDPKECDAVKRSGIHRIGYTHMEQSKRGLGAAMAGLLAALPDAIQELETVGGQRLVTVDAVSIRRKRYKVVDPRVEPPKYWR